MHGIIQWPEGFGIKDLVAYGISGLVVLDRTTNTIVKSPHGLDEQPSIDLEKAIYERLSTKGSHPGLLQYYGQFPSSPELTGIQLEYASNPALQYFLSNPSSKINNALRLRWGIQIADSLSHIHSLCIIHGDLTCLNIFLTTSLDTKLGDFAGSSIDGSPLLFKITPSYRFPGPLQTIKADVFAFGSILYQISTGFAPYHDLYVKHLKSEDKDEIKQRRDDEIISRYTRGEFPETDSLGRIGAIISRCWHGHYNNAQIVAKDIREIQQAYLLNGDLDRIID